MKIIPVLDILNGVAVHAVRGNRKEYEPLKSVLCPTSEPLDVACVFRSMGFKELYVADLDAITGQTPNYPLIGQIVDATGLKVMVDAGVRTIDDAQRLVDVGVSKIIIGTETLPNKDFVSAMIWAFGRNQVIVSLDFKARKILGLDGQDAAGLMEEFEGMGVVEFIVLDLTRVGSREGVDAELPKKALGHLKADVYVGGGVRGMADLCELESLGASGVLLATALHEGRITVNDLKRAQLL